MRRFALVGLVASLLLGAAGIFQAGETVQLRRAYQERALQSSVGNEIALISGYEHQTSATLAVMLADPALRQLLAGGGLTRAARSMDVRAARASLATIRRSSPVPMTAACLDDARGAQLACAPAHGPVSFPRWLNRGFVATAAGARATATSGVFLSPVSQRPSVAFLEPVRLGARLLGVVHLDVGLMTATGSSLLVHASPHVTIQLGSYGSGRVALYGRMRAARASVSETPQRLTVRGPRLGLRPRPALLDGRRALVAALPLTLGPAQRHIAVAAIETSANPSIANVWSPGLVVMMAMALVLLAGSIAGLAVSSRRIARELLSDPLTGLGNRRALLEELPRACERASWQRPAHLWFFDLNGFKNYNDAFGHVAGDALLARLANRLREALARHGSAYRLGGDEFCALVTAPVGDRRALWAAAREALGERGGAFAVTCAAGAVEIPREAREPTQALRLADQRMYREKAVSRGGAAELITSVLHAALAQRHPDLGEHCDDVAGDVELLARTIGLDEEAIGLIIKAGDLHDVGKLGIPDEIIAKPGALSEQEWEFMRQHTVMGEQIIAAAGPSLERIGPLVRASHERWDGKGYPDGLAGEEIPLGARIITICDSFRAMLDERSYKPAMSLQDALAELRRCAGTQFDPNLVEVFCRLVSERAQREGAGDGATDAPAPAGSRARSTWPHPRASRPAERRSADRARSSAAAG